jgi:transcription initiation factor TFIIIB Brf1 subunit/transcription initiation factor TFIIB
LDIALSKKIIVCEYCGRILVDKSFADWAEQQAVKNPEKNAKQQVFDWLARINVKTVENK